MNSDIGVMRRGILAGGSLSNMLRLHLGCGKDVFDGYAGVDIVPGPGVDYVCDLEAFPWPFEDSSVQEVLMFNTLEHLADTIGTMEELHRILIPGGLVKIQTPYYNSYGAFTDPTHKRFFSEETMDYFTCDGATRLSAYNYYSKARFEVVSRELLLKNRLLQRLPEKIKLFLGHHFAVISDIRWVLRRPS